MAEGWEIAAASALTASQLLGCDGMVYPVVYCLDGLEELLIVSLAAVGVVLHCLDLFAGVKFTAVYA